MIETQIEQPEQYKSPQHALPRFVVLGLAPDGFRDKLVTAFRQRGLSSIATDEGRLASTLEGVFFGHESAFDDRSESKTGKVRKTLGRLGLKNGELIEDDDIPNGVIVFPKIKADDGSEIDTPIERVETLCKDNGVPVVLIDTAETAQDTSLLVEKFIDPQV